jgi:5-formyltetrahydrofolate cyclo-ligase
MGEGAPKGLVGGRLCSFCGFRSFCSYTRPMHTAEEKHQLRDAMEERLKRMSDGERSAESRSLCRRLTEAIPVGTAVCAFSPLRTEPDITPLLQEILRRGDPLYLACFDGQLTFRLCTDLVTLVRGELGILEPPKDSEELDHSTVTRIVVVPGRAFDRAGNRLGRGNGGYDRWISEQRKHHASTRFIGAALECQIMDSVPVEQHDARLDAIATARGITECNRA